MEAKMGSLEPQGNEHQKLLPDQPSLEAPLASDVIYDDSPVCPRIGSEYQVEIPNLATDVEFRQLMSSPLDTYRFLGYDYPFAIGLPIPIMWVSHASGKVSKMEEELQADHALEAEVKDSNRDKEIKVTLVDPTCNNTNECDSSYQDVHSLPPANQLEPGSSQVQDGRSTASSSGECLNFNNKPMMQQRETEGFVPLPGLSAPFWSGLEAECFLLGLYIFGKNLDLVSRFVDSRTLGDIMSHYYGRFYKTDAYNRWSDCKKIKTRRCILGQRIFTGWRQQELISRLRSAIPKAAHDLLLETFKSLNEDRTSFEEFVFALKSTVGMEAFVGAVGIGKGTRDLTGLVLDPSRTNQVVSVRPEIPAGKACSSLAPADIVKFLTGDFRLSKTRSNDLFWEAVWPRLLARGWHSEQPKDVSTTKNILVFLVPGIKKFSRRKLTKGTHYFDSVSDVLKKVAADPVLLDLEVDGLDTGNTVDKNGWATDMKPTQNDLSDHQKQSYLHPRVPNCSQELLKFTVIDTSLVHGQEPFKVRELRSLPADANVSFGLSHHPDSIDSGSSSEEQASDDKLFNDREESEQVTANSKDIEMVLVYNANKEIQKDALQNMVTTSNSVLPANGHASDEQHSDISNGKGHEIDLTCFFGLRGKTAQHKYLSPVSKRRRLASCSNDRTSQRGSSFLKGDVLKKEESKLLSSSSKPIDVNAGGVFQTKTLVDKRSHEEKMNATDSSTMDKPHEKRDIVNFSNKDRTLVQSVDAVDEVPSKVSIPKMEVSEEGAPAGNLIYLHKLETPLANETNTSVCITSSDNHGCMKTDEAPSFSDSNMVPDAPEVTGNPVGMQPDLPLHMNPRRQGTRNRPPTARALEAVASGLLGGAKRKSDPKSLTTNRSPRRSRKSTNGLVSVTTSTDRDSSSIED